MRMTISWDDASDLRAIFNRVIEGIELEEKQKQLLLTFGGELETEMLKSPSFKKMNAPKKATETRVKNAKLKIFNALNMMRLEGRKINITAVAREAGVSYNTAKKYRAVIEAEKHKQA